MSYFIPNPDLLFVLVPVGIYIAVRHFMVRYDG